MPWFVVGLLAVYGLAYLVFAFVEPPSFLSTYFKVPSILVFLPDRWIVPVGRVFFGVVLLIGAGVFASQFIAAGFLPGQ
jgi:hypothetical protein